MTAATEDSPCLRPEAQAEGKVHPEGLWPSMTVTYAFARFMEGRSPLRLLSFVILQNPNLVIQIPQNRSRLIWHLPEFRQHDNATS